MARFGKIPLSFLKKRIAKRESGISLLEVLIAISLVAILGMALPRSLFVISKATSVDEIHTMARSLALNQMDSIQNQVYDRTHNPPEYALITHIPDGFSIAQPMVARLDPNGDGTGNDDGIQLISISIMQNSRVVYSLEGYKVNR
jgi:type II secretory pathway pseudopilin PulG